MDPREHAVQAAATFVPPPGLARSGPRDVELTILGRFVYILAHALFAAGIVVGLLLGRRASEEAARSAALNQDGVQTSAEVTRLWRSSDDSKRPNVSYRFVDDRGTSHAGSARIRLARWRALQVGSTIDVRYLPVDPERSVVVGAEPRPLPYWLPFVLAAALASGGVVALWALNCQRRLLSEGRPAPAVVTDIVKHNTSHGGSYRSIKYVFPLMSGSVAKGKSEAPRKPPAVGSVVCVVYDPDRPTRSRLYPFPLVKTARL